MRPISKPPGYYKDERGREYYWDGQHRSYIPNENPLLQLNREIGDAFLSLVSSFSGVIAVVSVLCWGFGGLLVGGMGGSVIGIIIGIVIAVVFMAL